MIEFSHHRSPSESLREYGRGIAGGLMFSLPLLYTMEVWWAGFLLHPWRILVYLAATLALLMIYNRFAGLRRDASLSEVAIDSVEELGIGFLISAAVLCVTGRVGGEMLPLEVIGTITVEAMTVAIGVSVGTAQLGAGGEADEGVCGDDAEAVGRYLPQTAIALCGAVLFAATVAPTEEVTMIAGESSAWGLLGIAAGSLVTGSLILHYADFRGAEQWVAVGSRWVFLRGIVTTYAVALLASAGLLWLFARLDGEPLRQCLAMTVVLGLPAVLGASAGRLLLQNPGGGNESSS